MVSESSKSIPLPAQFPKSEEECSRLRKFPSMLTTNYKVVSLVPCLLPNLIFFRLGGIEVATRNNSYTASSRVFKNDEVGEYSSAIAASDVDAISTSKILLLPRLLKHTLIPPIEPRFFHQNQQLYENRALTVLRNCEDLLAVKLPLEFCDNNVLMVLALPDLFTLEFRLPTSFTPTPQDIRRFQSLFAIHLHGFDQIEVIALPFQLVDTFVL